MLRLLSRVDISEETVELARSIQDGQHARETIEHLTDNPHLARYATEMTASTLSLVRAMQMLMGRDNVHLSIQLLFLCGVKRVWRECVLDDTSGNIPYELVEVAGFAGFVFTPSALHRVLPLPRGGAYNFLMRIDGGDVRFEREKWFQYILTSRSTLEEEDIDGIYRVLFDHPHDNIVEYLAQVCTETHMPIDVERGNVVSALLHTCVVPTRSHSRRCRSGAVRASRRQRALAQLLEGATSDNSHVATIVRDRLVHEYLPQLHTRTFCMDTLAPLVRAVQLRLPYAPLTHDMLIHLSDADKRDVPAWSSVLDAIHRTPPQEECVAHPVWRVRRHF